jgi:hypothetical protein
MATFGGSDQVSSFLSPNELVVARYGGQRMQDEHQNALLYQQQAQQAAGINRIEYVARAAAAVDGVPESDQPALYQQLGQQLVSAGIIPTLPPYPGSARIKELARMGTPSATLGERSDNRAGNAALLGGMGPQSSAAPAGGSPDYSEPRGIRNNNPLNLSFANQPGATLENHPAARFAAFANPAAGVAAAVDQLKLYQSRGNNTLRGMISTWAPPSENNTAGYVSMVAKETGLSPDQPVNLNDPAVASKLVQAMARMETGRPLDPAVAARGVAARTGGVDVAGPGAPTDAAPAPGSYTPSQMTRLQSMAADGKTTRAQMVQVMGQFDDDNRAAAQQVEVRREKAMASARADMELQLKQAEAANPRQGKELAAQYENDLLRLGPKIEDGTATESEKRQYSLSYAGYQISGPPVAKADPTDPTGRRQVLARLPREVPGGIPEPPYKVTGETGAAKPIDPTEGQAKASRYAGRMGVANPVMEKLDDVTTYAQRGLEKAGKYVGYNVNSADYQRLRVAQEAFLSGIIRQDSGAAVQPSEWDRYAHLYFPMPGDAIETVKMKARIRQNEMDNMIREAGPGHVAPKVNLLEDDPKYKTDAPSAPKVIRYDHQGNRIEQ